MQIVEPYAKPLFLCGRHVGVMMLRRIEGYARVSHRSEEAQTETSWERFIKAVVVDRGDWSVVEHEYVTVESLVDRGVSHEWVRHRIGAYTQESTRFVRYKDGLSMILPVGIEPKSPAYYTWLFSMENAEKAYFDLLEKKKTPQEARSVLPNALATKLIVTYNLRSWRQFLMARTTKETHPDFRRVTIPLLKTFQELIPILYDDLVPEQKQSISFSKPR